jgi:arsenite-transporting ATPase
LAAELYSQEIVGVGLLEKMAETVYGGADPARLFFAQKPIRIAKEDGKYVLSLHLPFVEKSDMDLTQKGEELFIRVGAIKRNIFLPRVLQNHTIKQARFVNERLKVTFN